MSAAWESVARSDPPRLTLVPAISPLIAAYLADCGRRGLSPATIRLYEHQLTSTERRLGRPIEKATPEGLAAVFDAWDLTPRPKHTTKLTVRLFYRWAADEGQLTAGNPARHLIPAKPVARRHEPGKRGAPTLYGLAETFTAERRRSGEITPLTGRSMLCHLAGLCDAHAGRPVERLDRTAVEHWLHSIAHLAPTTRRTRWSTVKGFCAWLVLHHHLAEDPTAAIKAPKVPRPAHRSLDADAAAALLAACPDARARCIILLGLQLGLRRAEIAGLEVGDLSRASRTLLVRCGKGSNERRLPLTDQAFEALSAYLSVSPAHAGPLIRGDRYPTRPVQPRWIGDLVTRLAWEAGIKSKRYDGISTHALRLSCASDVYVACRDVLAVRDMLGHVSLATTQIYVRGMDIEGMRAAMQGRRYGGTGAPGEHS